jgi:Family of unknown function (DUF5670)
LKNNIPASRRGCAGPQGFQNQLKAINMLYTIAVILIVLWLLGMVSSYAMGGFLHILLVVAIVMVLVGFISGRNRK